MSSLCDRHRHGSQSQSISSASSKQLGLSTAMRLSRQEREHAVQSI